MTFVLKCMVLKKPKPKSKNWNIKNFKHRSQKEMYYPKMTKCYDLCRSQIKLLWFVIILLWEVIYAHFYNWDSPLDFVPIVYDLIELIIEASLWSKNFVQIMLISFVWLYMFKCDVYTQLLVDQTQKDFWVFYLFLKVILYFRAFSFCSKCIFVFFFKNWFRGCFTRSSQLRASHEMCLREIKKSHFHTKSLTTASWVFHN